MTRRRSWVLPALVAVAQLALWPGLPVARGDAVDPVRLAAVLALTVVAGAALGLRRRSPETVLAVVTVAAGLGAWVVPEQLFIVPGDALLALAFGGLVALFTVSMRCSRRATVLAVAGLLVADGVLFTAQYGITADYPGELLGSAFLYALVAAAGRVRRRWVADRTAAARRLAEAEQVRAQATAAERRRLARELHDVTAHHLTSIVVNASAAQFLGDRRPELRAEALDFASRTGRETLTALHRLVAIMPFGMEVVDPPAPGPAELADDFRRLGQMITVTTTGEPPPPAVAEVLHGIAREALTNTLRYAPGGTVRLHCGYGPDGAELVVEDDGGGTGRPTATAGLGGGRGLGGMRERAESLGGTLRAGPDGEHGWRVHAQLPPAPVPSASVPVGVGRRLNRWVRSQVVLDVGLVALLLAVPLSGISEAIGAGGLAPAPATLLLLAVLAHGVPLLWRRRHPWPVLAAVALTTWLGPVLLLTGMAEAELGWLFLLGTGAEVAAVYAVAVRGARPGLTWLAPLAAGASTAAALAVLITIEPPDGADPTPGKPLSFLLVLALMTVVAGIALALPVGGSWLAGHLVRRRRQRRSDREDGAVAMAAAHADWQARYERARVAAGLRDAVLEHAARVPRAADQADLAGVLDAARAALNAMRSLLDGLGAWPADTRPAADRLPGPPPLPRRPADPSADPSAGQVTDQEVPSSSSG
ncbi:sensor histidine kinase [Micromonosporaceae bacterium Da 78-11]